jgi:peptidoglycan/xylan/chitin deacetylase (PgdA/CDA1 family)
MWTAIGRDWKLPAEAIASRLAARASNGAIFCLHDGRGVAPEPDIRATLEAVRRLIPVLEDQGYHFETVSEILCPKN